jgi:hypothetical protein
MTIGGWIFFILAGGAITALMVFSYLKVIKSESPKEELKEFYNQ